MKALSIKQPYASLIAHGIKDIVNSTWSTRYRDRIYIHVSQARFNPNRHQLTTEQLKIAHEAHALGRLPRIDDLPYGAIIGEVDIVDCVIGHKSVWAEHAQKATSCPECGCKEYVNKNIVGDGYRNCKDCGQEWWTDIAYGKPIYNWVIANPVLYDKPILNVKGKLSLWSFNKEEI